MPGKDNKNKGLGARAKEAGQAAKNMAVKARGSISKGAMWFGFYLVAIKDEVRAAIRGHEKDFNNAKDAKSKEAVMQTARADVEERIRVASLQAGTRLSIDQLASIRESLRHSKTPADLNKFVEQAMPDEEAKHESDSSKHTSGSSHGSFDVDAADRFDEEDDYGTLPPPPPTPRDRDSVRSSVRDSIQKLNDAKRTSAQFGAGVRTSVQSAARSSVRHSAQPEAGVRSSIQAKTAAVTDAEIAQAKHYKLTVEKYKEAIKAARITNMPVELFLSRPNRFTGAGVAPASGGTADLKRSSANVSAAGSSSSEAAAAKPVNPMMGDLLHRAQESKARRDGQSTPAVPKRPESTGKNKNANKKG